MLLFNNYPLVSGANVCGNGTGMRQCVFTRRRRREREHVTSGDYTALVSMQTCPTWSHALPTASPCLLPADGWASA